MSNYNDESQNNRYNPAVHIGPKETTELVSGATAELLRMGCAQEEALRKLQKIPASKETYADLAKQLGSVVPVSKRTALVTKTSLAKNVTLLADNFVESGKQQQVLKQISNHSDFSKFGRGTVNVVASVTPKTVANAAAASNKAVANVAATGATAAAGYLGLSSASTAAAVSVATAAAPIVASVAVVAGGVYGLYRLGKWIDESI